MASIAFMPPPDFWKEFGELKDRLANVEYKLDNALTVNATLVSEAAKAADARAKAEKRAAVAHQLVETLRAHHTKCKMDDAQWDANVDLQQQLDARSQELAELRQARDSLLTDYRNKEADLEQYRATNDKLRQSESSLERELAELKEKLRLQASNAKDIRANLDNAYADLTSRDERYSALQKQKDDADAELYAARLELKDAHEHYQQSQKRVEELESQKSAIEDLESGNATLQADHDSLQAMLDDRDRTILVKDARILLLETQVQKALAAERKALDEATKAGSATEPTTETFASAEHVQSESLEAEMQSLLDSDDFSSDDDGHGDDPTNEPEISLDYSEIKTIDITPVAAATTTASAQTTISSSQTGTSSTQTEDEQPVSEPLAISSEYDAIALWETMEPVLSDNSKTSAATRNALLEKMRELTNATRATSSTQTEDAPVESQPLVEATMQTDPPKLSQAIVETVLHYAPASHPPLIEAVTQTDAPTLTQAVTETILHDAPADSQSPLIEATTQTDLPQLTQAATETILQYSPTVHEQRHIETQTLSTDSSDQAMQTDSPDDVPTIVTADQDTQTDAQGEPHIVTTADQDTQANVEAPRIVMSDCGTQTDPLPTPTPTPTSTPTVKPGKSRRLFGFISFSTLLAMFFAWLSLMLYIAKEDWRLSNNRHGVNRLYNSMGYKRRGRHIFFGAIPVCYEHHENVLFEGMCQQFAIGVAKLEAYAGIEYPPRW